MNPHDERKIHDYQAYGDDSRDIIAIPLYPDEHECDRPDLPCLICNHEACGWCPDCSPGVPEI